MPSSERGFRGLPGLVAAAAFALTVAASTRAEAQAQGFALERFQPSAPGGGWFVMDALDMHGALGGAMSTTVSYARNPLRLTSADGTRHLSVVSDQAFADFGFAATYEQFRFSLDFAMPLAAKGKSGTVDGVTYTAPNVDLNSNPDTLSDARLGFDARLLGTAHEGFRLGLGAQLFVPNGARSDYDTEHTYRATGRLLFAGDLGGFTYAGHGGVHVRPLDDGPTPGSPRGSELLFGAAAGWRASQCDHCGLALVLGPEVYGASAFHSLLAKNDTALEALLGARLEGTGNDGAQLRVRIGGGVGLNPHFGAPEGRVVIGIEVFNHRDAPPAPAMPPASRD